ncbi:MAG: DNA-3-methyladenine glycosylase I [Planctomycetota bacterium]|jgi:DNA-3-methyladenine glycosylase I
MNAPANGLLEHGGRSRCYWCGDHEDYRTYHDEEWGRPVHDDRRLYEKVCLESFQSGLSWLTILRKRENFRAAFANFEMEQVAAFGKADVERLLGNAGIVRHRGKIEATIKNARAAIATVEQEGSLHEYFWRFEPPASERPQRFDYKSLAAFTQSPTSKALAKDLKRRGWAWVGPTTAYAFMQAMGLVNDHFEGCWVAQETRR